MDTPAALLPDLTLAGPAELALPAAPELLSYTDRLNSILNKTGFIDELCSHIANGGDYITVAQLHDIKYSDLYQWMIADISRGMAMAKAEKMRVEWVRQRVLNELRCMALTDLRDAFTTDGGLKKPEDWPEHIARALAGVETEEIWAGRGADREMVGHTKKIKLHSKTEALKLIGSEFGLFIQKHKVEVTERLEDLVADSYVAEVVK